MAKSWNCKDMDSMGETRRQLRINYLNDHDSVFEGTPEEIFDSQILRGEFPNMLTAKLNMPMPAYLEANDF